MEIKTKFDLGQVVFPIGTMTVQIKKEWRTSWKVYDWSDVREINLSQNYKHDFVISYLLGIDEYNMEIWREEPYLFATKEEAQAECDRRNEEVTQ